jgi:pimeloyl-ACP methyl ester carboxylesterase
MLISEPQKKFIRLDDLNLHYLEWGTTDQPPMVMLHGWQDNAWLFKRFGRQFENSHHLFSLDLRGHGETTSDIPGLPSHTQVVADLTKFLEALNLQKVTLVGFSYGGTIAHRYTAEHPERIEALCIIDIGVDRTEATFRPDADPVKVRASQERAWERFRRIQTPTLIIRAEHSDMLSAEVARQMVESLPQVKFVEIKDSDHRLFKRYTELVEALREFLDSYPALTTK